MPATKPAAATIGAVPDGTLMRLFVMNGVDDAWTLIAFVPSLRELRTRRPVAALLVLLFVLGFGAALFVAGNRLDFLRCGGGTPATTATGGEEGGTEGGCNEQAALGKEHEFRHQ